jgi:chromatin remodeling complex protein RSC6
MSTPVKISDELAEFMEMKSGDEISPQEIFKYVCDYVTKHDLFDKNDRRIILCDEKLKNLLKYDPLTARIRKDGTPEILNYFTIMPYLRRHFVKEKPGKKEKRLIHLTDPEQNKAFQDKYFSGIDISNFRRRKTPAKVSEELSVFMGSKPEQLFSPTEVDEYIFNYVKEHHLNDEKNHKIIVCDDKLKKLLGVDTLTYFQIHRCLVRHFSYHNIGIEPETSGNKKECEQDKNEEKSEKKDENDDDKILKGAANCGEEKLTVSAFTFPVKISQEIAEFLELDSNKKFLRRDITKYICNYIIKHDLFDKNNRRIIICDEKLKNLLKYDSSSEPLTYFNLSRYLNPHFIEDKLPEEKECDAPG